MKKTFTLLFAFISISITGYSQTAANSTCATASPISLPSSGSVCVTGTTVGGASITWQSSECGETIWPSNVWYTFVSTGGENTVIVSPTGTPAAQTLGISLYTGGCDSLTSLGGACEISSTTGGADTVSYPAPIGTVFSVEVSSFGTAGGFQLCVTSATSPQAPGNSCATATHLCTKGSFTLDTVPEGGNGFRPDCFQTNGVNYQPTAGQWYQFTVGVGGALHWACTPTTPCTVHSTLFAPGNGVELDWAMYDITNGCPTTNSQANIVDCNFNYEEQNSDPVGMKDENPENNCGGNGPQLGTAAGEFCPPYTVVAGQTYAIFINNFTYPLNTGWDFNFDSSTFEMAPVDTFLVSPDTICGSSGTVTITNNSIGAIWQQWNFGDGATSVSSAPGTHSYTSPGAYFISLTDSSQTGCTAVASKSVLISAYPTMLLHNDTICPGGSGTLTDTPSVGGGKYLWSTGATTASITASPAATTAYSVTFTSSEGCTVSGTGSIVVSSNPATTITPATVTICPTGSATLLAGAGSTYVWSTGATSQSITVTPTASTTYKVTVTLTGGCTATASSTVTVSNNTTTTITPATVTICPSASTTLTAGTGTGYVWSNGASTQSITVTPTVTTTYTVTVTLAGGCTATANAEVTVANNTTTTVSPATATICPSGSATFTAGAGTAYSWSNGATTGSITVLPTVNTTYTVTVTSAGGCTATASGSVSIVNNLTTSITPQHDTICPAQTATLTAGTGNSYMWSNSATTNAIDVSPAATTAYQVTVTSGTCTASATATVAVIPFSISITPAVASICGGGGNTVTLNCSYQNHSGNGYTWSPNIGSTASVTAGPITTTTYTVVATNTYNCTASASAVVNVDNVVLSISPATPNVCSGQGTTLTATASGNARFAWSNNVFTDTNTVSPGTTTEYTVVATDTANCTAQNSVTVTIAAAPIASFTTSASLCVGQIDTVTFTGTASGSPNYDWTFSGGTPASETGKGPYYVSWSSPGTQVISLGITDNGCVAVPDSQTVIVDSIPVSFAGADTTFCSGTTVVIGTASTPGYTYLWNPTNALSSATVSNPTVNLTNTSANVLNQTYTVTTNNNGCSSKDSVTLTVDPIPVPQFTQPAPQCLPNNSFNFTASGSFLPGATFAWNFGTNATPPTSTLQSVTVNYSAAQTTAVSLTISQMGCVSNPFVDSVTVNGVPTASFFPNNTIGCQNLNVCFTDNSTANAGTIIYLWNFGDGQTSTVANPCHIYTTPGTYSVYLNVTDNNCSDDSTEVNLIKIIPAPVASFTPSATIIQQPQSEIDFTNQSLNASAYSWNFGGIGTSTNINPSFSFTQYGLYNVVLVASDSLQCTDTAEIAITVLPPQNFFIPNVFTPNNDGQNDQFYIEMQEGVTVVEFTVFDRWGEKVHDGQYPWDGTFKGKPCPQGVYVYVFKLQLAANTEGIMRTGSVTLLR